MRIVSTDLRTQGPFVIIEDGDFNPETHTEYVEEPEAGPTREEMKALLTAQGVEFAANIKQPALVELYNAEKAKG